MLVVDFGDSQRQQFDAMNICMAENNWLS